MADITAQASGAAESGATWIGGTPPGSDDVAIIGAYTVTFNETTTIQKFTLAENGVIIVDGCTLGVTQDSWAQYGTLQIDNGGRVEAQAESGIVYICGVQLWPGDHVNRFKIISNGTSQNPCSMGDNGDCVLLLKTGSSSGDYNDGYGNTGTGRIYARYTNFKLGTSDTDEGGLLFCEFDVDHCLFDTCGLIGSSSKVIDGFDFVWTNNTHKNSINSHWGLIRVGRFVFEPDTSGTATRSFDGSVFDANLVLVDNDATLDNTIFLRT